MSRLGSLLVRDHIVGVTQIEEALQRQVLTGGDLSTCLLELSLVDEETLTKYAARAARLPALKPDLLANPDPAALKLLPWQIVNEHRILPVLLQDDRLVCGVCRPLHDEAVEKLSFLFGVHVICHLVLEFRLAMALNLLYGLPIPTRLLRLQERLAPEFTPDQTPFISAADRKKEIFAGEDPREHVKKSAEGVIQSRIVQIGSTAPRRDAFPRVEGSKERPGDATRRIFPQKHPAPKDRAVLFEPELSAKEQFIAEGKIAPRRDGPVRRFGSIPPSGPDADKTKELTLADATAILHTASDRDIILRLVIEFARQFLEYAALFVIHGKTAQGRNAAAGKSKTRRIDDVVIPLDQPGMFETVFSSRSFYLGRAGTSEADKNILKILGRKKPLNCVILPIAVRRRVILMVYGDSGERGVTPESAADLVRFAQMAGEAFERLLLEIKTLGYKRSKAPAKMSEPAQPAVQKFPDRQDRLRPSAGYYHVKHADPAPRAAKTSSAAPHAADSRLPAPSPEGTPSQPAEKAKPNVIVEMKVEIERLVDKIVTSSQYDDQIADQLVGFGEDALDKLMLHFPGPLLCSRYLEPGQFRGVGEHGPLLKTVLKFQEHAVPHIVPFSQSDNSDKRFYAVFLLTELATPEVLADLTPRLFDSDRQIRALAIELFGRFDRHPKFAKAIQRVIDGLTGDASSLDEKRTAAEIMGELRVPSAVSALADMLGTEDGVLADRCYRALVKITFKDFGFSRRRWLSWWKSNRLKHRVEWAIDSLAAGEGRIRNQASDELKRLVGDAVMWPSEPMKNKQRRDLKKRLSEWWEREGATLYLSSEEE